MEKQQCPCCGEEIMATAKKCKHCNEWLDIKKEMTDCPFCSEEIEAGSKKCVHCNELIAGDEVIVAGLPPDPPASNFSSKAWLNIKFSMPVFVLFVLGGISLLITSDYGEALLPIIWTTAIIGLLLGMMYFILSSYVRTVSKENSLPFSILAILELTGSVLGVLLWAAINDNTDKIDEIGVYTFLYFFIIFLCLAAEIVVYIFCCSTLFKLEKQGVKGTKRLGSFMLFYIVLCFWEYIFNFLVTVDESDESIDIVFFVVESIAIILIIIQMYRLFERLTKSISLGKNR